MNVFLSYASADREVASRLHYALVGQRHDVFFDREDLPYGDEYDQAIRRAVEESDLVVFLISPDSVAPGRYTLTELGLAERRWRHPAGRVLPVVVRATDRDAIPAYLRAVSILEPAGDAVAEAAHEVGRLARSRAWYRRAAAALRLPLGAAVVLVAAAVAAVAWWWSSAGGKEDPGYAPLPLEESVRRNARALSELPDGFALATANPPRLFKFSDAGERVREPIPLPGEPVALSRTPQALLIGTRAPAAVVVVDPRVGTVVNTIDYGDAGELRSVAASMDKLWAVAVGAGGDTALLRLRPPRQELLPVEWTVRPEGAELDLGRMTLYRIGSSLWGLSRADTVSTLYRMIPTAGDKALIRAFPGRGNPMMGCAAVLAESANGFPLLLTCDNELVELDEEGRAASKPTALPGLSPEGRRAGGIGERIAVDKDTIFVALDVEEDGVTNARILRVDATGVSEVIALPRTKVESLVAKERLLAAVIQRADGTLDAISIPRTGAVQAR